MPCVDPSKLSSVCGCGKKKDKQGKNVHGWRVRQLRVQMNEQCESRAAVIPQDERRACLGEVAVEESKEGYGGS